ncbi:MAG TPA: hypothetical protein VFU19_19025 [Iamia sp.]|nr:hypothetical protein [Iamia sp.]
MTSTTHPAARPSAVPAPLTRGVVRARGELVLLHRRALSATGDVVDRALTYGADDPRVVELVRSATLANLVAAEYLGRWSMPGPTEPTVGERFHRSAALVDEAMCQPGALDANVPLASGRVGDGAALLAERIVALDRAGRALASAASVHRTVDAELDLVVSRLVARIVSGSRPVLLVAA